MTPNRPSARQIAEWRLASGGNEIVAQRQSFDDRSDYRISVSEPRHNPGSSFGEGCSRCNRAILRTGPRRESRAPELGSRRPAFAVPTQPPCIAFRHSGKLADGPWTERAAGPAGACSGPRVAESVRKWYRDAFGETIDVAAQGSYSELVAGSPARDTNVRLVQSGRGLSHVLPVVVMALTAAAAGPGVDVIEAPRGRAPSRCSRQSRGVVACQPPRPDSAHGRGNAFRNDASTCEALGRGGAAAGRNVLVYWIHAEPGSESVPRKIAINERGEMDSWPDGVFFEDYEEILAIGRAARTRGMRARAHRNRPERSERYGCPPMAGSDSAQDRGWLARVGDGRSTGSRRHGSHDVDS